MLFLYSISLKQMAAMLTLAKYLFSNQWQPIHSHIFWVKNIWQKSFSKASPRYMLG
jgi:hypothetical protein